MNAVFIASHPDDIEFGCAGTINKLIRKGFEIHWVIMTNGENDVTHSKEVRLNELYESASQLKVKHIYLMDFRDGYITADADTIQKITDVLNKIKPDVVFTHYHNDRHQDHRNTSFCVRSVCWGVYNLLYFNSFSSIDFSPNLFIDISYDSNKKTDALKCYTSQLKKFSERGIDFINAAISVDKRNGVNIHCDIAEGYKIANCKWEV